MRLQLESFFTQKAGCSASEYEDAFFVPKLCNADSDFFRIAIADGASETSFARLWAKLLVAAFGRPCTDTRLSERIDYCRSLWMRRVTRKSLPWYAQEKMQLGAFSTLLGLTITGGRLDGKWEAVAVGDSCLFHVRDNQLLEAFPVTTSEGFGSRPTLISSVQQVTNCQEHLFCYSAGQWQFGDILYLMTDALACWFLKRWEIGADPLYLLREMATQEAFENWITNQRQDLADDGVPLLKNDDVTLVVCHFE